MKIKSYRAASLREALVQIKEELGEDALVLETRQVRGGGFLGVGARNLVEVRVAPNSPPKSAKDAGARRRPAQPKKQTGRAKVNLRDDSSAMPGSIQPATDVTASSTFAALAARTYANHGNHQAEAKSEKVFKPAPSRGVELAETPPLVNDKKSDKKQVDVDRGLEINSRPPHQRNVVSSELARLRAEVREVKFSLETFASRPMTRTEFNALTAFEDDPTIYDSPHYETYLELTLAGLSPALAREAARRTIPTGATETPDTNTAARTALVEALPSWVQFAEAPLQAQAVAAFVGPTGVGKTTTIAKLAARIALRARRRVELITLDTYRIAAVQQLKTYAEIIGARCHIANSVVELDALARRFAGEATVLVDTTGRSPHDLADQMELADYLRENETILKCLVLPATTHPVDAQLALNKFALYGANRLVLTKLDETAQPGSSVGVAAEAGLPLIYLCAGQRVPEDLARATPLTFAAHVVRTKLLVSAA